MDVGVAEFSYLNQMVGKVHRPKSGIRFGPRRNRSQYNVACGNTVRAGKPVVDVRPGDWCGLCWPEKRD